MVTEVQWSELQRDPKSVARLADQGDVRVRRRDGAPLLLIREDRAMSGAEGAITAARALRNVLVHLPVEIATEALLDEFPWVDVLPKESQAQFVSDFARAFQASAELGEWAVLAQRSGNGEARPPFMPIPSWPGRSRALSTAISALSPLQRTADVCLPNAVTGSRLPRDPVTGRRGSPRPRRQGGGRCCVRQRARTRGKRR